MTLEPEMARELVARFGANVREFFRAGQRASLISPLFNVPARLVLGGYCYFEHAAAILREIVSVVSPEELGRRMKGLCVRPNYVNLQALALGYLNGREQLRLRAGLGPGDPLPGERLEDDLFILDFWHRCCSAYVEGGAYLPLETGYRLPILSPEEAGALAESTAPRSAEERASTRRAMAIAELYTFILNGEARVGVFHHGPYDLDDGEVLVVKELVGLRDSFLPWRLDAYPPVSNLARLMRLRRVEARIDLFGSLLTDPFEYEEGIVADRVLTVEDGSVRDLAQEELEALARAAGDAQVRMYEQAAAWAGDYRIAYGADLYGALLAAFPRLAGLDLDARIREAFADSVDHYLPGLRSGDDTLLILHRLGASEGSLYTTAPPGDP